MCFPIFWGTPTNEALAPAWKAAQKAYIGPVTFRHPVAQNVETPTPRWNGKGSYWENHVKGHVTPFLRIFLR